MRDAWWAQEHNYGVLAGGCVNTYDPRKVRDGLVAVSRFHSAHCVVYFEAFYDNILQTVQPFDISLGLCGVRGVVSIPFAAVQRPTFSGILQKDVNYVPLYEMHEKYLMGTFA